jgi:hypothetical protein
MSATEREATDPTVSSTNNPIMDVATDVTDHPCWQLLLQHIQVAVQPFFQLLKRGHVVHQQDLTEQCGRAAVQHANLYSVDTA